MTESNSCDATSRDWHVRCDIDASLTPPTAREHQIGKKIQQRFPRVKRHIARGTGASHVLQLKVPTVPPRPDTFVCTAGVEASVREAGARTVSLQVLLEGRAGTWWRYMRWRYACVMAFGTLCTDVLLNIRSTPMSKRVLFPWHWPIMKHHLTLALMRHSVKRRCIKSLERACACVGGGHHTCEGVTHVMVNSLITLHK